MHVISKFLFLWILPEGESSHDGITFPFCERESNKRRILLICHPDALFVDLTVDLQRCSLHISSSPPPLLKVAQSCHINNNSSWYFLNGHARSERNVPHRFSTLGMQCFWPCTTKIIKRKSSFLDSAVGHKTKFSSLLHLRFWLDMLWERILLDARRQNQCFPSTMWHFYSPISVSLNVLLFVFADLADGDLKSALTLMNNVRKSYDVSTFDHNWTERCQKADPGLKRRSRIFNRQSRLQNQSLTLGGPNSSFPQTSQGSASKGIKLMLFFWSRGNTIMRPLQGTFISICVTIPWKNSFSRRKQMYWEKNCNLLPLVILKNPGLSFSLNPGSTAEYVNGNKFWMHSQSCSCILLSFTGQYTLSFSGSSQ